MASTTFTQHFTNLPSNEAGNKNMSAFSSSTASSLPRSERLRNVTATMDYVIATADGENNIQLIHSMLNVGGTMIRPVHKILGLIGTGSNPVAIIVQHEFLTNECEISTPLIDEIKECSTAAEIKALVAPEENGAVTYPGSACFAPAPWLANILLNEESKDPHVLILTAFASAIQFDSLHEIDSDFNDKAIDHAEDFALWAWGVSVGRITETKIAIRPDDGELLDHLNNRMKQCIMPTVDTAIASASAGDNTGVFLQLSTAISKQSEEAGIANLLRREEIARAIEREETKKDKSNKLHPSIMKMLLMASSTDGDQAANELPATCLSFFNKESEGLADQELRFQFEALGYPDVNFANIFCQQCSHRQLQIC